MSSGICQSHSSPTFPAPCPTIEVVPESGGAANAEEEEPGAQQGVGGGSTKTITDTTCESPETCYPSLSEEEGEGSTTSPSQQSQAAKSLKKTACSVRRARQTSSASDIIDGDLSNNFVIYNWAEAAGTGKAEDSNTHSVNIMIVEKVS